MFHENCSFISDQNHNKRFLKIKKYIAIDLFEKPNTYQYWHRQNKLSVCFSANDMPVP